MGALKYYMVWNCNFSITEFYFPYSYFYNYSSVKVSFLLDWKSNVIKNNNMDFNSVKQNVGTIKIDTTTMYIWCCRHLWPQTWIQKLVFKGCVPLHRDI